MPDPVDDELRFSLLGPVRAWRGPVQLAAGRPQQQVVLAALLLDPGRPVGLEVLLDAVWGEQLPAAAVATLRGYVSRLRRTLGAPAGAAGPLVWSDGGYLLCIPPGSVDGVRFEHLLREAAQARTAGRPARAETLLAEALALPTGAPLAGLPGRYAERHRERLAERIVDAEQQRAELGLDLGRHAELVAGLAELTAAHPLRERLRELSMLALYRCGRQAEAIAVFQDVRRRLDADLGVAPGPTLARLYERILCADPSLDPPAATPTPTIVPTTDGARPTPPRTLPRPLAGFVERRQEWARLDELAGAAAPGPVVVAGPAGSGKTTLVVRWAHAAADRFPDGQLYGDLQGFGPQGPADPGDVAHGFLRALGVPDQAVPADTAARAELFREQLRARRLLVVLDNVARPADAEPFLPEAGPAMTVVCSRDALTELVVTREAAFHPVGVFTTTTAHELLRLRLGDRRALEDTRASRRLAELCDHLPLALAIALARLVARPAWSVADLVGELEDEQVRLAAFGGPDRLGVERELGLSRRHLPEPASRLLPLLALHPGAEIDAYAAAALLDRPPGAGRGALAALAGLHLLQETGPGCFQAHDLVRLYCRRLAEEELDGAQRQLATVRLLDHYLAATAAAVGRIRAWHRLHHPAVPVTAVPSFDGPAAVHAWFRREEPAVRQLVLAAGESGEQYERACRLVENAGFLYNDVGLFRPWEETARAALAAAGAAGDAERWPHLHSNHSLALAWLGRFDEALGQSERASLLAGPADRAMLLHRFRALRSSVLVRSGRAAEAIPDSEAIVASARAGEDPRLLAQALNNLANAWAKSGDPATALPYAEESMGLLAGRSSDPYLVVSTKTYAQILHRLGRYDEAIDRIHELRALGREQGSAHVEFDFAEFMGTVLDERGRRETATEHWRRALELATEQGRPDERLRARLATG
ncbi:BTAD domain-containing putative transcriptional regulator [Kitasatospora sp. NPDC094015]|uniref:AfsR/SARP family transcriptional regulator n=1 Tax=Kitasatospora sp. NPDC094015 TaxID=3155205 RepID=UPI003323BF2C